MASALRADPTFASLNRSHIKQHLRFPLIRLLFDPQTVKDRATFKEANLPSEGIIHVLVGGVSVVKNASLINDVFPGQGIRR